LHYGRPLRRLRREMISRGTLLTPESGHTHPVGSFSIQSIVLRRLVYPRILQKCSNTPFPVWPGDYLRINLSRVTDSTCR
jgi:hypothetical protein